MKQFLMFTTLPHYELGVMCVVAENEEEAKRQFRLFYGKEPHETFSSEIGIAIHTEFDVG